MGQQENLPSPDASFALVDQMIGEILTKSGALRRDQIDVILEHQAKNGSRFGESAVVLGIVKSDDVLYALAQQFHYPYSPTSRQPGNGELVTAATPYSKQAETFRVIRGQLLTKAFSQQGQNKALAVISANRKDGKTFFAANIAVVLSQLQGKTLVIDADMRSPRLHELFGMPNNTGLSGILSGRSTAQAISSIPDLPNLFLLPGGPIPPNPIELIERPAFSLLLAELISKFDYVVVDTPAGAYGADATAIAQKCGSCLCIAREGNSKLAGVQSLLGTLAADSVKLAGVILNEYR